MTESTGEKSTWSLTQQSGCWFRKLIDFDFGEIRKRKSMSENAIKIRIGTPFTD